MKKSKPFYVRKIADDVVLTDDLSIREDKHGWEHMQKAVENMNEHLNPHSEHEFSWSSERVSQRETHYFLTIVHGGMC